MLSRQTLAFLKALKNNNHREWFQANKDRYESALSEMTGVVDALISEIAKFDKRISGLSGKQCLFRIYRDVRFAKDKSPYKNHLAAWIAPGGKKGGGDSPGYYLHIEPGCSLLAGGVHAPQPPRLARIRDAIAANPGSLGKVLKTPAFKKLFPKLEGGALKSLPRGYPKDHPDAAYLKHKDFVVSRKLSDAEILSKDFSKKAGLIFKTLRPLNTILEKWLA